MKLLEKLSSTSRGMWLIINNWISLRKSKISTNKKKRAEAKAAKKIQKYNRSVFFTMSVSKDSNHIVVLDNQAYRLFITEESIDCLDGKGHAVQDQELLIRILREVKTYGVF